MVNLFYNIPSVNNGEQHNNNSNINNILKYLEFNKKSIYIYQKELRGITKGEVRKPWLSEGFIIFR